MRLLPVLLALPLLACAAPEAPVDVRGAREVALVVAGPEAADAVLVFGADWSVGSPELTAGMTVAVDYDLDRLPDCRGRKYGQEAWAVVMYWRIGDGELRQQLVGGPGAPSDGALPAIELDAEGSLEAWFLNSDVWGCSAWDSAYGGNYGWEIGPAGWGGWVGNGAFVIDRAVCDGLPCEGSGVPLEVGFVFGTWARQRAALAGIWFEVWEEGVTDPPAPDLWQLLDVQIHWQWAGGAAGWDYVDQVDFVGNNARYSFPLRAWDPLRGWTIQGPEDCPDVALALSPDGATVSAAIEYHIEVDGLAWPEGPGFQGSFVDHAGPYLVCGPS